MNRPGRLIIVCGLPGSGKTTYARTLEAQQHAIRFCPDEWFVALYFNLYDEDLCSRVESLQWQFAQDLLTHGLTVVIEWGTWGRDERDALRVGARALGASVELHYLTAPLEILFERIRLRGAENPPIEFQEVEKWASIFQVPTEDEFVLFDPPTPLK